MLIFSSSYSYDLTHNLQHQMAPIINPKQNSTATDSWQAWGPCNHFDQEAAQDISSSAGLSQSVEGRSEPILLKEDRMLDQATPCSDQAPVGDLKNCVSTGDEQVQCNDVITDCSEKEENDETFNGRLTSSSDEDSASTSANGNGIEQNHSADDITNSPAKESTHISEVQTEVNTSTDDPVKDGYTSKETSCPECKILRQRKEKVFLSKKKSCAKFAWNRHLLCGFEGAVHPDWILHIVNGFVGQSGILFV